MKTQQQIMDEEYRRNSKKTATAILKRTLHVDEKTSRKKSPSPPSTPPRLERANAWYAEPRADPTCFTTPRNITSPTDLASRLAVGVSESFNNYPDVSTYFFVLNNKKVIHRDLSVYHVGVRLFESGKPWTFYITTPQTSVRILETTIESDREKGISRLLISPPNVGVGSSCNPLEFITFLQHVDEIAETLKYLLSQKGEDVTTFKVPMKYEDGTISGLYVKVRNPTITSLITNTVGPIRLSLKLTCLYVSSTSCGLSFEASHAFES